jgi:thiol:disulfide interchange protein
MLFMKTFTSQFFVFFLFLLPATFNAQASQLSGELPVYSRVYDASRNPNADGRAALKLAKETNRKVLIEVGGDWCSWCFVLDRFIREHPKVESRLHQTFVVLKVNISDENDNVEFMAAFPPAQGYPHMYVTDSSGNILSSQDTADFRENKKYSEARFMAFLDRWQKHE